jgi:hypothetical protein
MRAAVYYRPRRAGRCICSVTPVPATCTCSSGWAPPQLKLVTGSVTHWLTNSQLTKANSLKSIARYGRVNLLCIDELGNCNSIDTAPRCSSKSSLSEGKPPTSSSQGTNLSPRWIKTFTDPRLGTATVRLTFAGNIVGIGTQSYRRPAPRTARRLRDQPS